MVNCTAAKDQLPGDVWIQLWVSCNNSKSSYSFNVSSSFAAHFIESTQRFLGLTKLICIDNNFQMKDDEVDVASCLFIYICIYIYICVCVYMGIKSFGGRKYIDPKGDSNPNLRIHAECSNHLSYQGQTFAVPYCWIRLWRCTYFCS